MSELGRDSHERPDQGLIGFMPASQIETLEDQRSRHSQSGRDNVIGEVRPFHDFSDGSSLEDMVPVFVRRPAPPRKSTQDSLTVIECPHSALDNCECYR